jgi:hypothetical protein
MCFKTAKVDISELISVKLYNHKFNFSRLEYLYKVADLPKKIQNSIVELYPSFKENLLNGYATLTLNNESRNEHDIATFEPFFSDGKETKYFRCFELYYGRKKATSFHNRNKLLRQFYFDVNTNQIAQIYRSDIVKKLAYYLCFNYMLKNRFYGLRVEDNELNKKYSFIASSLGSNYSYLCEGLYPLIKEPFYEKHFAYLTELFLQFDNIFGVVHNLTYLNNKCEHNYLDLTNNRSVEKHNLKPLIKTIDSLCFDEFKKIKKLLGLVA